MRGGVYIRCSLLPFSTSDGENMRVYLVILLLGLAFASAENEDGMLFSYLCYTYILIIVCDNVAGKSLLFLLLFRGN